jgi:hypothetical protein
MSVDVDVWSQLEKTANRWYKGPAYDWDAVSDGKYKV